MNKSKCNSIIDPNKNIKQYSINKSIPKIINECRNESINNPICKINDSITKSIINIEAAQNKKQINQSMNKLNKNP